MVGAKAITALFTMLGILLALIGLLIAWMANMGMVQSGVYVSYGLIGFGIILVFIGLHIFVAGVASLRGR